ncbi:MAG: DUF1501 domain-containing protein [Saprospiraceae bacterium]|nr:DUF1501 domain-containing protein [Saprospiraceae bacterium]
MKRRQFINRSAKALALPIILNNLPVRAFSKSLAYENISEDNDKILVLIQMNGGNDGLNTVLPFDQYDNLINLRSNIIIPQNSAIGINNNIGLHPSLTGLKSLYDNAKLTIVQNVGYPNQNRSHFRSTDIWTSGSASDVVLDTGWLGRYFDQKYEGYPENYPNADYPDPFAITIGSLVSETCQGTNANFSLAVVDPSTLSPLNEGFSSTVDPNSCYGTELTYIRSSLIQTNAYSSVITNANNAGANLGSYPSDNALAQQLKIVAKLISGGLKTKVYVLNIGSFDTHSGQVESSSSTTTGNHADLLSTLSEAILAFQNDITALGFQERVLGMTFSEFGRQIASNFSDGTDHGTAAPLFLFGSCVMSGIVGNNPQIPVQVSDQEGVAMEIDFRSIYGTILADWFKMDAPSIANILFDGWQHLPILRDCDVSSVQESQNEDIFKLNIFPSPTMDFVNIEFMGLGERTHVSIFDARGYEVKVVCDKLLSNTFHSFNIDMRNMVAGNYYLRLATKYTFAVKSIIKI